jgi:predicted HicB family RNase H-like nuclease
MVDEPKNETKVDLYLTIPPALNEIIDKEAKRQGQTTAALVRGILNDWADKTRLANLPEAVLASVSKGLVK